MFGNKKVLLAVAELQKQLTELRDFINQKYEARFKGIDDELNYLAQLEMKVDRKLIEFHKEFTDKYFDNLNAFLRWNKEIALVSYMGGKDPDIAVLKRELMKPYLEEKWATNKAIEADRINQILQSQGEQIRQKRENLYQQYLKVERENKDLKLIQTLKAKLEILDEIIKGAENADK